MTDEIEEEHFPEGLDDDLELIGLTALDRAAKASVREANPSGRRKFVSRRETDYSRITLHSDADGVLSWDDENLTHRRAGARAGGRAQIPPGTVSKTYVFEKLKGVNQIAKQVAGLDDRFTNPEKRDLYRLNSKLKFDSKVASGKSGEFADKRLLLLIHGTFSHADTYADQMNAVASGKKFLRDCYKHYDAVLAFNHPTLSVSPMVNAHRIASLLRDEAGPIKSIDIVCHSRGGLVARWWLEGFADPRTKYQVVFVGSPLGGTTLASPTHLKSGMDLISNVGKAVGTGASKTGFPLLAAAGGILSIASSITSIVAKGPILDAVVAAFPGLMGQARTRTNFQLESLWSANGWKAHQKSYHAIISNFEPDDWDKWKFWRLFNDPSSVKLGWWDAGVDKLVFAENRDGDNKKIRIQNDLVVDTDSMIELGGVADPSTAISSVWDFGTSNKVHHTNYFDFDETYHFFRQTFKISG